MPERFFTFIIYQFIDLTTMKRLISTLTCSLLLLQATAQTPVKKTTNTSAAAITFASIPDSVTGSSTSMATYLASHSESKLAALRSLYGWMSSHIQYDMVNTFKPDYYKDTTDAIRKTLQTRTAVCQGYSALFMDVCRQAGIPACLISGYTLTNGKVDNASHAWVAVLLDNEWQLIDPTWGSGGVINNKYIARVNWKYFLVSPAVSIKTHVPFDPLYQFLEQPLRHDEIRDGKWAAGAGRPRFAYRDTLAAFTSMSLQDRAANAVARIDRYGVTNQMVSGEMTYLINVTMVEKHNAEVIAQNGVIDRLNACSSRYNRVVNSFNDYVVFRNNQFTPTKPDKEIREWVDGMMSKTTEIEQQLQGLTITDPGNRRVLAELEESVAQMKRRLAEEQAFVTKYIKTGKVFRKSLFYKLAF
ncbi:transglutaminase domain-containing protein [Chitinophaga sp. HK235]|uniref:transglutaminase domain-containing protein n=1 Tax=Chitinophaga sp. HK235 TaxID=2952571 RepID=UPI001BA7150F|nr:transglutaminase domain-containing protein [Chitinophaga sp. HK235]